MRGGAQVADLRFAAVGNHSPGVAQLDANAVVPRSYRHGGGPGPGPFIKDRRIGQFPVVQQDHRPVSLSVLRHVDVAL